MAPRKYTKKPTALAKRTQALEAVSLRARGVPYAEIASRLGVNEDEIRMLVTLQLEAERGVPSTSRLEGRALAIRRAELALNAIWEEVESGNLLAIDRYIKLNDQLTRLHELPAVRVESTPSVDYEDDAMQFIRKALAQAAHADVSEMTLPEILKAVGPLLDRLERKDENKAPPDERLARINHLLDTARARRAGAPSEGTSDALSDGVQEEGDEGL